MRNSSPRDTADRRIALIERRQHGPIRHAQLIDDVRLSREQVKYRLRVGRLRRVYPEVYVVGLRELDELGPGQPLFSRAARARPWLVAAPAGCTGSSTANA